jgi:fibro-slime domain-containing protein
LDLPIIYRDFAEVHSDFGVSCGTIERGIPENLLTANGKPELSANSYGDACITSKATFSEWYTDAPTNSQVTSNIVLFDNGNGGYVNRLNNEGDRYEATSPDGIQWCSNDPDGCDACPAGYSICHAPCTPWGADSTQTCAEYDPVGGPTYIDGNPLFFPIDELMGSSDDLDIAHIPEEVYGGGWQADPSGTERNFYFTSEIAYWFEYTDGMTAELSFVGDDDMWVFVNGRLAVDLGGLHVPVEGKFTLNADGSIDLVHGTDGTGNMNEPASSNITNFGLEPNNVYEVKVFQAERKKTGSSYRLTLSGFNSGVSDCVTNCGDGEVGPGEECDDGPSNLGGYNQCTPDCTLGPRCGDGVQQEEEACDYGEAENIGAYGGCAANCELGPYCGDGLTSEEEECDNGVNSGGYGECAPGCVLGPVCGDGGLELEFEECDDGNNVDRDGCSAACKIEIVVLK